MRYAARMSKEMTRPWGGIVLAFTFVLALAAQAQTTEPPAITTQPASLTNAAGTYPKLTVVAAGTAPLAYQWFKEAQPLPATDTAYSGAQSALLTVNYAQKADEGQYWVVITNSFGAVTSSVATLTVQDPALAGQPSSLNVPPGGSFTASAAGTTPFTYQWLYNGTAIAGATTTSLSTFPGGPVAATNPGSYQFVARNTYGSVTSAPAMLTINATTLDGLSADANGAVFATAVQADGRLVLGGAFTSLGVYGRSRLGRLLPDGKVDTQFNPTANGDVYCLLQQADGKLLVGGAFTTLGGQTCRYLGRLHANGTLDTNFTASVNGTIYCLAWQRDGLLLAGGYNKLLRLDQTGALDSTFNPSVSGTIYSIVAQEDSAAAVMGILVGGSFSTIAGGGRANLARLRFNGQLDSYFNAPVTGTIYALALQRNGEVVLGGQFSKIGQASRTNLARVSALGSLVDSFNPAPNGTVYSIATQADGKLVVGGSFTTLAGVSRSLLGRLNPDGSIDPTFNPGANSTVYALALQADGELLVGGNFSTLGGGSRNGLGRLNTTGDAAQQLLAMGNTLQWLRGGALPEVEDVVFEQFVPGSGWTQLNYGQRSAGGWQAAASVSLGATWRARGNAVGGRGSGSGSSIAWVTGPVVIATEPVGQSVSGSSYIPLSVSASGSGPLTYQWFRNGAPLTAETNATYDAYSSTASYQVVVCNPSGCMQSQVASIWRLDGVETAVQPNPNAAVWALAVQADGKVLVGGSFTNFSNTARQGLARMNADGSLDVTFAPEIGGSVFCLAVMPDNRIVIGGSFVRVGGQPRRCLACLNADGTLDESFVANISGTLGEVVYCLARQADGKLLVGGNFESIAGQPRTDVARLEASGAVDAGFVPPANPLVEGAVNTIVPQSNGLILLGGPFMRAPGYTMYRWVHPDGTHAGSGYLTSMLLGGYGVRAALEQLDGKLVLGGQSFQVDMMPGRNLARLNPDRSPDATFPASANGPVLCLVAQADGKIIVGGNFSQLNGVARNDLGRLLPDGSLDSDFNPGVTGAVYALAMQPDGKVLLGGLFSSVGTVTKTNVARLTATAAASESWSYDGSSLTWWRDGLLPELEAETLESSPDGVTWQTLTGGTRISGGWQMSGVTLPATQQLRARGQVSSSGVSAWQTETVLAAPTLSTQSVSRTNAFGSITGFYVVAKGPGPFGYQWYHDGVALADGGGIAGARGPLLTLQVTAPDAGDYWVTVTNWFGSVTSSAATLTTLDPAAPPQILAKEPAFGFSGNHFTFRINAVKGQTCVVDYSYNLKSWYPVVTNVGSPVNPWTFTDPASTPSPQRFYRVRLQ
jgi:uncharacterized delta-60 repeat protein